MLELQNISKDYEGKPLLNDISFRVNQGETICLLGASGSGKSTLLRIVAGLESPDLGRVSFNKIDITNMPPHLRDFGLVFQDYALFPHLDVFDNVAFGLRMRRMEFDRLPPGKRKQASELQIKQRVNEVLGIVNLSGFEHRKVTDLSGGEQQRVALARALAPHPRLLMFDEPLGALDRALREEVLDELRLILRRTKVPAIYVTHDQEEAFAIADRILLLHEGGIACEGSPEDVTANPCSAWAAKFLGLGNVIEGVVIGENKVQTEFGALSVRCGGKRSKGDKVDLLVRPFEVREETNVIEGEVADVIFQQDKFKVTLKNGLYFYLHNPPKARRRKIAVKVSVECLA